MNKVYTKERRKNIDTCTFSSKSYCSYIYHRSLGFLQQFKFEFFLEEWVKHLIEGSSQSVHPLSVPLLNQMTELVLQRKKYGTIDEQHIEANEICAALSLVIKASPPAAFQSHCASLQTLLHRTDSYWWF